MSELAVMPLADYKGICDKVREKTGTTEPIKSGDMVSMLDEIGGTIENPYVEYIYYTNDAGAGRLKVICHNFEFFYSNMFANETALTDVDLTDCPNMTDIGSVTFQNCQYITEFVIPETITILKQQVFQNCYGLTEMVIPASVQEMWAQTFYNCKNMTKVTFKGTPTKILNNVFNSCTALKTINVPWAEGAVANAPWGATNATINYNYVEGGA